MKNFRSALLAAALSLVVAAGSATAAQATTKIRVGASPTPHAEILKVANDVLKPQGYELQIIEYSDYVQPNMALEGKELDANFFQHEPYLVDFNKAKGTELVSAACRALRALGHLRPGKTRAPSMRSPRDGAHGGRAQRRHQRGPRAAAAAGPTGLITLKEGADASTETATVRDIAENPQNARESLRSERLKNIARSPARRRPSPSSTATTPSSAASKWPTRCPPKRPTPSPRRPTPISSPCAPEMKTVLNSRR